PALDCGGGGARCHNTGHGEELFGRNSLSFRRLWQERWGCPSAPPGKRWPLLAAPGRLLCPAAYLRSRNSLALTSPQTRASSAARRSLALSSRAIAACNSFALGSRHRAAR